jgi:predicted RNA-binding Zn ribbon-like protein
MDRPLAGEPLALDLVNTWWLQNGEPRDLLSTVKGLTGWLRERGLPSVQPTERVRSALVHTRAVLRAALTGAADADEQLNAVLARGFVVRTLEGGRVRDRVVFTDDVWAPAWQAANDYLRLREAGPERIRQCEQRSCVLYFYDTTGRRRWCSMAGCGNRAKASRHYARERAGKAAPQPEHT